MSISTTSSAPTGSRCAGASTRAPRPLRRAAVCCIASSMARKERKTGACPPRRYGAQKPAQQGRTALSTTAPDTGSAPARTRSNVLLVDDDQAFVDLARPALESAGYSVSTVPTGEPALQMLTHLRPDVVVADVPAGETDGVRAAAPAAVGAGRAGRAGDPAHRQRTPTSSPGCASAPTTAWRVRCRRRELAARVSAKTARPPVPADLLSRDLRTGLLDGGDAAGRGRP